MVMRTKMLNALEAKKLVTKVGNEVRSDAMHMRLSRTIKLVLESFSYEHVFTELLQNADDCIETTSATIEITDKAVFFTHNGKPFNEQDFRAICDIGVSTKKPDAHIGFMGIGFKASFKLSDTPHVFSGPFQFHFSRDEVIVPHWVEEIPQSVRERLTDGKTLIYLPFRKDFPRDIIDSFIDLLEATFQPICLVFLRKIKELNIVSGASTRSLKIGNVKKHVISVTETKNNNTKSYEFYEFRRSAKISDLAKGDPRARDSKRSELKKTDISIVLNIKDGVFFSSLSPLYTFLPTPYQTGLRFVLNGDFLLNTQRTEPDWTSAWNRWLFSEAQITIEHLVKKVLRDHRQRLGLFNLMPRKTEVAQDLFKLIFEPLINFLKNSNVVLASDNTLMRPEYLALASKEIQRVVPAKKAGAKKYVHPEIKGREFLREELSVKDFISEKDEKKLVFEAINDKEWLSHISPVEIQRV